MIMKSKKKIIIISSAIIVVALVLILSLLFRTESPKANVLLFSLEDGELVSDEKELSYSTNEELITKIIDSLRGNDENENPIPEKTEVNYFSYSENGKLSIDFSSAFLTEDSLNNSLRSYAVIKSICSGISYTGIQSVFLTVDGKGVKNPSGEIIEALSFDDINSEGSKLFECTLYYTDKETNTLRGEKRAINTSTASVEYSIIKELLKGPVSKELKKTISSDVTVASVSTVAGVCYIDFAGDDELTDEARESIEKTLLEIEEIKEVKITFSGKFE